MPNGPLASPHRVAVIRTEEMELEMAKFYCLVAALAVFAPVAFATLNQAAQIVV